MREIKNKPYFVYDENQGFQFFESAELRDIAAKDLIQDYLDVDGWDEDVDEIIVGKVTGEVVQCDLVRKCDIAIVDGDNVDHEGRCWNSDIEEMCNYKLVDFNGNKK